MHGQGDVAFVLLEEVDGERVGGEDLADSGEERGGVDFEVRMHVYDCDLLFDGDCRGPFRPHGFVRIYIFRGVGLDDRASGMRAEDILDADGDSGDALLEGEIVDYFAAVEGQLPCFVGSEGGEELGGGDFSRVGGEDAINFLPDLELAGGETDGDEGGA